TSRQAEHDLSVPDQRRQLRIFCQKEGLEVVGEYEEPGHTADDRRSVFQEMMIHAHASPRPFDAVIVHSYSRFFRDAFLAEFHMRQLRRLGIEVVSITQPMPDDPAGELIRKIIALFDEYS